MSKALRSLMAEAKKTDAYWVEATKLQFSLALEQRRKLAGMTYKAIADKMGASAAYVSKVFRGDTNMTIETMIKLSRATGGHLVVQIVESEAMAEQWDYSRFIAKHGTKPRASTTEATVTTASAGNDARFSLAA